MVAKSRVPCRAAPCRGSPMQPICALTLHCCSEQKAYKQVHEVRCLKCAQGISSPRLATEHHKSWLSKLRRENEYDPGMVLLPSWRHIAAKHAVPRPNNLPPSQPKL